MRGYDFVCGDKSLDESRPIPWSKIPLILDVMQEEKYDWIFWSDADALIMNTVLYIEDLIDENYNLIICNDFNGLNIGHFLIRNCEWSRRFLREVYAHEECMHHLTWDQQAMLKTLQENYQYSSKTKTIPQRLMNSFSDVKGALLQGTYQPGDFVIHFAGIPSHRILKTLFEHYYLLIGDHTSELTYEHYLGIHDIIKLPSDDYNWYNWSTDEHRKQYDVELKKHPTIKTIAQIGTLDGMLSEVFFKNCPQLQVFKAYPRFKRFMPFCRATCDYLSRKYRLQWQESSELENAETVLSSEAPFDLIHMRLQIFDEIFQAKKLADEKTLVWIDNYNLPQVKEMIKKAVKQNILEVIAFHASGDEKSFREWIEARYCF